MIQFFPEVEFQTQGLLLLILTSNLNMKYITSDQLRFFIRG